PTSPAVGDATLTTTSASHGLPIRAPASVYAASGKPAATPAPASTTTSMPSVRRPMVSGTSATRCSSGAVSFGIPTRIAARDGIGITRRYAEKAMPPSERFFAKHGGKTVFFGRFISIMRVTVAWLAGMTRMRWWEFLAWNALGGIVWATGFGLLAYFAGKAAA